VTGSFAHLSNGVLTLGNDSLQRRFAAAPGQPFITTTFANRLTGREFAFAVDGQPFAGLDFTFERADLSTAPDRAEAVVHAGGAFLAIELHFIVYADHPVIRKWLVVTNCGERTVTLTDFEWEDVHLLVDTPAAAEGFILAPEAPAPSNDSKPMPARRASPSAITATTKRPSSAFFSPAKISARTKVSSCSSPAPSRRTRWTARMRGLWPTT